MKMHFNNLLLVGIFWLFISTNCKKNNPGDGLPPLTFEGKNSIGCRIDGAVWVPKGKWVGQTFLPGLVGGFYVDPLYPNVHLLIITNDPNGTIEIFCRNYLNTKFLLTGKYLFNKNTEDITFGNGEIHSYGYLKINGKNYFTDSLHTGWIEILKLDTISGVISGRFQFDAYNASDDKTYKITDGRFDIK